MDDVLEAADTSRTTLEVRMKRAIGKTPQVAIASARIERGKRQLLGSIATVGQIAQDCGYPRQERFNVVFKRLTGMTPGQFRQQRAR